MAPDQSNGYIEFTDQQRTRVVSRGGSDDAASATSSIGNTQAFTKKKEGLFDGLSIAQIIAGAAAAATSMVLSSKIGIAGSVIGAAVSSVVTVVSSQLYRRFLTASAEKIKQTPLGNQMAHTTLHEKANQTDARGAKASTSASDATMRYAAQAEAYASSATTPATTEKLSETGKDSAASSDTSYAGTRVAPEYLQQRAKAERSSTQRKVVGFSIVIAVVAVIVCAVVILVGTAGEGLGERTTLFSNTPTITEDSSTAANDAGTGTDSSSSQTRDAASAADSSSGQTSDSEQSSTTADSTSGNQNSTANSGASTGAGTSTGTSGNATQSPTTSNGNSSSTSSGNDAASGDSSGDSSGAASDDSSATQPATGDTTQDADAASATGALLLP